MSRLDVIIDWLSKMSGLTPLSIKWMGVALLLFLLLMFLRKPWKMVKLTILLILLGSLAYVGYDLAKTGVTRKEKLMENPIEEMKKIGD